MVICDKDMGYKNGWTKQFTKDNGIIIKLKVKEYFGILKVIFILAISETTKQTVSESTSMLTVVVTKANGSTMFNKAKEKKSG